MTQANGQAGLLGGLRGCASWQDIRDKWRGFSEKLKGDLFEELVKAYLQLEPEYASKLKHIWLYREVPQAVACKLKLPVTDDRIVEYFRAVSQGRQCKDGGRVEFDIDERLAKRIDLTEFVREIELKCWDRLAKLSWRPFEEAREFATGSGAAESHSMERRHRLGWYG